jgi:phosphatidylglycerophosphate synthase
VSEPSIVNPANAVTLIRGLSIFPLWYFVHQDWRQPAFAVLLVGGFMDLVDGWVAKAFDCRTAFGAVFDSITDGLLYGSALIVLGAYGWAPAWPVVVIVTLGVLNAIFRMVYSRRVGRTINYRSIAMERFTGNLAFLIGLAIVDYEVWYYFPVCSAIMAVIVIHDAKRMLVDPVPGPVPA